MSNPSYRPEGKKVERTVFQMVGMESCTTACPCDNRSQETVVYSETTLLGGVTGRYFTDAELTAMDERVEEMRQEIADRKDSEEKTNAMLQDEILAHDAQKKEVAAKDAEIERAQNAKRNAEGKELEALALYDEARAALDKARERIRELEEEAANTQFYLCQLGAHNQLEKAKREARAAMKEEAAKLAYDKYYVACDRGHTTVPTLALAHLAEDIRALKEE